MFILFLVAIIVAGIYWLFFSPYSQVFGKFPYQSVTDKKVVALTFDDGPNEPYTSQLLEVLEAYHVSATFFVVGQSAAQNPKVIKNIIKAGHVIGLHGYTHKFRAYFKQLSFKEEILNTQKEIYKITGKNALLFRPPWLFHHPLILKAARQLELTTVSGKFAHDFEVLQPPAVEIAKRAMARTKPGSIIIFHDGFSGHPGNRHNTVRAVELLIENLKAEGYRFVTVDQLLKTPAYAE